MARDVPTVTRTDRPSNESPVHDNRPTSEDRVRRFLREQLPARRHLDTAPLTIEAWEVPDRKSVV